MPLTSKGEEIKSAMTQEYGEKKGEEVFYASIQGVDSLGLPVAGTFTSRPLEATSALVDNDFKFLNQY